MRVYHCAAAVATTLLLCTLTAGAEGQNADTLSTRGGFIIGFGLGPGYANTRSFSETGVGYDFKIGGTAGKQWQRIAFEVQ